MASVSPASMQVSIEGSSVVKRREFKSMHPPQKKTCGRVAGSTAASIPSRYQTYVVSNSERKGFSSQAPRFTSTIDTNENPGPGRYGANSNLFETHSASFSKKGSGGFASKSDRFRRERKQVLGPSSYNPRPTENRLDFNKAGASSSFTPPIAIKSDDSSFICHNKNNHPAPNTYDVSGVHTGRATAVGAEAAFKSRTKRELPLSSTVSNPAPCQYSVQDSVLHPSSCTHQSVFNSKSNRNPLGQIIKGPGPADYKPMIEEMGDTSKFGPPKHLPYYRQKHYLCISAPAMPLAPLPPLPGPGHYETQGHIMEPHERRLAAGAVFKSSTCRWGSEEEAAPGPGYYNPLKNTRQSYLFNVNKKWI